MGNNLGLNEEIDSKAKDQAGTHLMSPMMVQLSHLHQISIKIKSIYGSAK